MKSKMKTGSIPFISILVLEEDNHSFVALFDAVTQLLSRFVNLTH